MKMMKLGSTIGLLLTTVMTTELRAATQFVFFVGSEFKDGWTKVSVKTDDASGEIEGLFVNNDFYRADEVKAGTAVRIDGADNSKQPLKIKGASIDAKTGGRLVLSYLYDGRGKGSYHDYAVDIRQDDQGRWKVYLPGGTRPVRSLYMTKNTTWGFTIGIEKINATLAVLGRPASWFSSAA